MGFLSGNTSSETSNSGFKNKTKSKVSFVNYNPTKRGPPSMVIANDVLNSVTGATKKNKEFMLDNYSKIDKNYKLPDRATFDKMDVKAQSKTYTDMRQNFALNNKNPLGEKQIGRDDGDIPQGIELAKSATGSATISGPGEIQKKAANTTAIKMSAAQTNISNKRKGRISTNVTAKKSLAKNYTLSKKSLLG